MKYESSNYQLIWTSQFWSNIIRPLPLQLRGGSQFPFVHCVNILYGQNIRKGVCSGYSPFSISILESVENMWSYPPGLSLGSVQPDCPTKKISYFTCAKKKFSLSLLMKIHVIRCSWMPLFPAWCSSFENITISSRSLCRNHLKFCGIMLLKP